MRGFSKDRLAVSAMFFANGLTMGAWAPQIPLLLPRHGIGEGALGLLILLMGAGAVAAMLFAGRLIDRFGAAQVLRVFAFALVAMLPAVAFAPSVPVLAVAMVAFGALTGCMDVAMNANAVEVERRLGRAIMSASHGFWSLGGFLGGSLGAVLVARAGAGVQALVVAALVAGIVGLAGAHLHHAAPHPRAADAPRAALIPRDAGLWLLGLMALLAMIPEGAVMDWAALYLMQEQGAGLAMAGLGFGFFSGSMALMRFAGDGVRNRFGAVRVLRVSALVAALGLMGGALAPSAPLAIAAFALAGLGIANTVPVLFSAAGNHPGLSPGAGIAVVTMLGYSGILVAPASIGYVAEHLGFRLTYATLAGLLVLVAALAGQARAADQVRG